MQIAIQNNPKSEYLRFYRLFTTNTAKYITHTHAHISL